MHQAHPFRIALLGVSTSIEQGPREWYVSSFYCGAQWGRWTKPIVRRLTIARMRNPHVALSAFQRFDATWRILVFRPVI